MQNINMNLLKYFYYVAKYSSYTKAAEELLISQPSLSYSIKVLEIQLNKKLFNRGKSLELTTYGEFLYKQVDEMMNIMDKLSINDEVGGKIIIGMRPQYAYKVFPFYFHQLSKIYPNLNIEYVQGPSNKLKDLLYTSQIDILIDEYEFFGEYESFLQLEDDIVLFKDKNNKNIINDNNIADYEIGIIQHNKVTSEIKKMYGDYNYIDFQSTPLLISELKNRDIIGIGPKSVIKEYIDNNEVILIDTNLKFPKAKMYITYNKKLANKNIEAIVNFFKEHSFYELNK